MPAATIEQIYEVENNIKGIILDCIDSADILDIISHAIKKPKGAPAVPITPSFLNLLADTPSSHESSVYLREIPFFAVNVIRPSVIPTIAKIPSHNKNLSLSAYTKPIKYMRKETASSDDVHPRYKYRVRIDIFLPFEKRINNTPPTPI